MIPLGPLRLLPQVRATEEEKDRATQGFKKDLWGNQNYAHRLQMAFYLRKRKDREGVAVTEGSHCRPWVSM